MAVSGYQNPLEYQMYSALENKEDDVAPVTTTNLTETQPITTTAAPTTTALPRSSLDILQSAGLQPTQTGKTAASDILKGVGVTSAKDVLRSMYFERPGGLLEGQGISAASILEDYRKEQAAFRKTQDIEGIAKRAEADLLKKEQEFIKNYRYDLPQNAQSSQVFQTKLGNLQFDPETVSIGYNTGNGIWAKDGLLTKPDDPNFTPQLDYFQYTLRNVNKLNPLTNELMEEKNLVFLPLEHITKGMYGSHSQKFNTAFLDKKTWEALYQNSQAIDLTEAGQIKSNANVNAGSVTLNQGFLFERKDYEKFFNTYLKDKFYDTNGFGGALNGPILGIAERDGQLVYVKDNVQAGRYSYYNMRITADGRMPYDYTKAGPIKELNAVTEAFAKIPFGAEIAFIASGGNPYVYASLKAVEIHGKGGDSGDILKGATTAFVSASVGAEIGTYGEALGQSIATATNIPIAVANTIGTAVVNAGFNGFMAAATGGDVEDAMLAGAIGGGLSANAGTITNAVFGGAENVAALSKTLNLSTKQTQTIFTGALASGAVNSIVKNQSFMDAFTESLIVQGVSQSGANAVGNSLKGTMSPKAIKAVQDNTRIFLQASARAAVRGEDMETAIARVAPYLVGRSVGQSVNIATSKK